MSRDGRWRDLRARVVLVTGPARGIGAECARMLAARGARLALVGLEAERLAALRRELGDGHVHFHADVTDQAALDRAVEGTVAALGGIDVVVANAGVASSGPVATTPVEALVRTIDVNLAGVLRTVRATLPHVIERRGYYLLVSSASAIAPLPGIAAYAASKSGVEQLGNVLRLELARHGVGVGVANPGWIDTDLVRDPMRELHVFARMLHTLPGPFGRVTPVRDCAAAFVRAIERRERRIFVPRALGPLAAIRQLFAGPLAERIIARQAGRLLPRLEHEVAALGRPFGAHSVGMGEEGGSDA